MSNSDLSIGLRAPSQVFDAVRLASARVGARVDQACDCAHAADIACTEIRHDVFACPCCAEALALQLRDAGVDLAQTRVRKGDVQRVQTQPVLITNAQILTMDPDRPTAVAMLVRDGRIAFVGEAAQARALADERTLHIDGAGRTLLPGFIEPHMHLVPIAVLSLYEDVGPFRFSTVAGALQRLREVAQALGPEQWVVGRQFDPSLQDGPDVLTREMLDEVSIDQPVFVYNASLHFAYCNSKALAVAGVTKHTDDPPGSPFGRDADGVPNGVLKGGVAMGMVGRHNSAMRQHDVGEACLSVLRKANRVGVTTLCDQGAGGMQGGRELELFESMRTSGAMTARYRYSLINNRAQDWDNTAVRFADGDAFVRASGWKIVSDGSNQGRTGLQRDPFLNSDDRGIAYVEPSDLNDAVRHRLEQGWPVVVHANGDAAIDRALAAFAAAKDAGLDVAGKRCRIEHCSILHDEQIAQLRDLGVSPSFLIGHVYWWGQAFRDQVFGADKAALLDRTAACEAQGIRWTLHSDEPVTEMNPLRCIENAVTRRLWKEPASVLAPHECISVDAALRAMTIDAAWQCHSDHEVGSLEVGKLADFVVLAEDPRQVPADTIGQVQVLQTWLGGRKVFDAVDSVADASKDPVAHTGGASEKR